MDRLFLCNENNCVQTMKQRFMKEHTLIFVTVKARVQNILGRAQHHTVPAPVLKCDILFHVGVGSILWKIYVLLYGNKMPTRCNGGFIADLIACSTCFGHHYAHHQELKSIIQWLLPVVFHAVKM